MELKSENYAMYSLSFNPHDATIITPISWMEEKTEASGHEFTLLSLPRKEAVKLGFNTQAFWC